MLAGLAIVAVVPDAPASGGTGWWAAGLALAIAVVAARGFVRLRGTTLAAPAAWTVAAALGLAAAEVWLAWRPELEGTLTASIARYAAAVGTFCPIMAVLGAKRPQDRGWQWVVLSLWAVLLVPAGQAWASRAPGPFYLPFPWNGLVIALLWAAPLNYLPTRWWLSTILFLIPQAQLLRYWLGPSPGYEFNVVGFFFMMLIATLPPLLSRRLPRNARSGPLDEFTIRWLSFRNGWGAFWGLRILNRINETAELGGWPVRLRWQGFMPVEEDGERIEVDHRVAAQIEQTMDSLLRRFERIS